MEEEQPTVEAELRKLMEKPGKASLEMTAFGSFTCIRNPTEINIYVSISADRYMRNIIYQCWFTFPILVDP